MTVYASTHSRFSDSLLALVREKSLHKGYREEFFRLAVRSAADTMGVQRASIWLFSSDNESIDCACLHSALENTNSSPDSLRREHFPTYFEAMLEERVIDASDAIRDPRTCEFKTDYLVPLGISSMLDAPIIFDDDLVGVICIEHVGPARHWTSDEIAYVGSLADLIWRLLEAEKREQVEQELIESESRYRRAASLTKVGHQIWCEVEDRAIYCSRELADMHGLSVEEYLRRSSSLEGNLKWYHPDDQQNYEHIVREAVKNRTGYETIARIVRDDGEIRYLHEIADVKLDADGNLLQTIGATQDITRQYHIEQEIRTQSQIISSMINGAMLIRISDRCVVYANSAAEKMFGYESGQILGISITKLYDPDEINLRSNKSFLWALNTEKHWKGEILNLRRDGSKFWCDVVVSTIEHPLHGKVWVFIGSDVTEKRKATEQLEYHARHDDLTGLTNRREFERKARSLLKRTRKLGGEHALCYIDLDQFKIINDSCGHSAGDALLRQLGELLDETVRHSDTLARLGGDEFGVLMEHCSLNQAEWAVSGLLRVVQDFCFEWEGNLFKIGASIGLVAIDKSSRSLSELLKQADAACYMAKDLGRNRIQIYSPDDTEIAHRHGEMAWISRINRALEQNQFVLFGQEIYHVRDPHKRHCEVLVRMLDDNGQLVLPGAFLAAAERYDIAQKIDEWVVSNALSMLGKCAGDSQQLPIISINLSGQSLSKPGFRASVIRQIKDLGINPANLCFEITETATISQLSTAREFIHAMKRLGCRFALDDFGSGLSSFGYLKSLPVDYLKIDGMFVKDICQNPIDLAMVKSINEIGQVMGMKTIAEFVENDEILKHLVDIGVDCAQGYGIGKPEDLSALLNRFGCPPTNAGDAGIYYLKKPS